MAAAITSLFMFLSFRSVGGLVEGGEGGTSFIAKMVSGYSTFHACSGGVCHSLRVELQHLFQRVPMADGFLCEHRQIIGGAFEIIPLPREPLYLCVLGGELLAQAITFLNAFAVMVCNH
jgi:hypothetical protein